MRCGSVVLSLLLLASFSQAQLITGTAAAVAGAVGLAALGGAAALGVAALASRGGGRRGGSRSFGRSRGRGFGGRRGFLRGRRSAPVEQEEADDVEEQSAIWGSVAAADQDGCALKLICLLEAADSEADDAEQTILGFFGELGSTDSTGQVAASKLPYEAAGWLGKRYGAGACQAVYGAQCPHSKADMMQLIASVWSNMTSQQADAAVTSA